MAALLGATSVAQAANITAVWDISDAIPEPPRASWVPATGHTLFLKKVYPTNELAPGFEAGGEHFNLDLTQPSGLIEYDDGTAHLFGRASNGVHTFDIDFTYSGYVGPDETPPADSPKGWPKNQPGVTDDWWYYTGLTGTLSEVGGPLNLQVSRVGPAFQLGNSASLFNTGMGASNWFEAIQWVDGACADFAGGIYGG
ncbi:MAG: hypothetical protein ACR2QG_13250, partial [Gammaproteobacteria bacterium]